MAVEYRVWIQIERYDEKTDEYTEMDVLDFAATATFSGRGAQGKAKRFASKLNEVGEGMAASEVMP